MEQCHEVKQPLCHAGPARKSCQPGPLVGGACFSAVQGVGANAQAGASRVARVDQLFRRHLAPGALEQVGQRGFCQPRQPHQHQWIVTVVVGEEEGVGIRLREDLARNEIRAQHQRLAVLLEPRQQLAADLERRRAVGLRDLHFGKFHGHRGDLYERNS